MVDSVHQLADLPSHEPHHRSLRVQSGDGQVREIALAGESLVIGRGDEAKVKLDDDGVSRRHAELFRDPFGRWWVRDLGSSNGTLVNGFRVNERMLEPDDQVQIGLTTLQMVAASTEESGTGPSREATPVGPNMAVKPQAGRTSIERLEDSSVQPKISAQHLSTLMALSQRLQTIENLGERFRLLCSLMVSQQFAGRAAVVIRLNRKDPGAQPLTLCEPQAGASSKGQTMHVTASLLEALRAKPQPMLASEAGDPGSTNFSNASEAAASSAMACPLGVDDDAMDVLYVMAPQRYANMEWLTLISLAAQQFRQAEGVWASRRQARVNALVEHDLQRGRDIQMRLIPREPKVEGIDVAVSFIPCRWVAGDYVDVLPMGQGKAMLVVADVCGKGLPAALVSSSVHTIAHTAVRIGANFVDTVTLLNEHLYEHLPANRFVTGVFVLMDPATGDMQFINAGHPAPMVFDATGARRSLETGDFEPLGLTRADYRAQTDKLAAGEMLAMYTDGLTELRDQSGRMLTMERLGDHLRKIYLANPQQPLQLAADALNQVLDQYQGDRLQADDRTFLLARRGGGAKGQ